MTNRGSIAHKTSANGVEIDRESEQKREHRGLPQENTIPTLHNQYE
jgi:hypothetical protein